MSEASFNENVSRDARLRKKKKLRDKAIKFLASFGSTEEEKRKIETNL